MVNYGGSSGQVLWLLNLATSALVGWTHDPLANIRRIARGFVSLNAECISMDEAVPFTITGRRE